MGFFDTPAVKALKNQAQFIGGLVGDAYVGHLAPEHRDAMLYSETRRSQLRELFEAAAGDVGPDKALKAALKSANMAVDVRAQMANLPRRPVAQDAEAAVRDMLGR